MLRLRPQDEQNLLHPDVLDSVPHLFCAAPAMTKSPAPTSELPRGNQHHAKNLSQIGRLVLSDLLQNEVLNPFVPGRTPMHPPLQNSPVNQILEIGIRTSFNIRTNSRIVAFQPALLHVFSHQCRRKHLQHQGR
jgi:hypothetical protein